MKIKNFEDFKFQCNIAFLEEVLREEDLEIEENKYINLPKPALNKTSRYLFPSIRLERILSGFKVLQEIGFVNMYCYYDKIPIEYSLHLLFNPPVSKLIEFADLLDKFSKLPTFIESTKLNDNVFVISLLMLEENKKVFYPFINAEYSKMGEGYADLFAFSSVNGEKVYKQEYHIIKHTEFLQKKKEQELGLRENFLATIELDSEMNLQEEILNYKYIKNGR